MMQMDANEAQREMQTLFSPYIILWNLIWNWTMMTVLKLTYSIYIIDIFL